MARTTTPKTKSVCEIRGAKFVDDCGRDFQHVLAVSVDYCAGGLSYYDNKRRPQGYSLQMMKQAVGLNETGFSSRVTECGEMMATPAEFLAEASRFNGKRLNGLACDVIYPGTEMAGKLSALYGRCRENHPDAGFPEIAPADWLTTIALYR